MTEEKQQGNRNLLGGALMAVAVVVAAGVVGAVMLRGGDDGPEVGMIDEHRPEIGEIAPDFALVDVRDGETVRQLSDFRGQVVVLNWYASWCGPCAAEIPAFQEAQDALEGEAVFFLVNLQESRDRAEGFLDDLDATLMAVLDSDAEIASHYRVTGMPTTFFIDRDGRISAGGSGYVPEESLRAELAALGLEY